MRSVLACLVLAAAWGLAAPPSHPGLETLMEAPAFSVPADQVLATLGSLPRQDGYGVVVGLQRDRIQSDPNGRVQVTTHWVFRVDHEGAVAGWGQVQAYWQPWLEGRPEVRARVITPDGKAHTLDPATLTDAQVNDDSAEMYRDTRLVRGPLPMLRVGAVAEVELRWHQHRAFAASGHRQTYPLAWQVPVYCSRLQVLLPSDRTIHHRVYGLPASAVVQASEGPLRRFQVDQGLVLPLKPREPFQAFDEEPWPSLLVSTAATWEAVAGEYLSLTEAALAPAPGRRAWVMQVVGDAPTREARIQRVLDSLHRQVRYVGLEFGASAIVPRTPEETWTRGYGDCKDQSVVMVAMLRELGIEAHLALVRAGEMRDFSPEFPGLAAFNHCIVHLPGKAPLWIDPTVAQARLGRIPAGVAGRYSLVIAPGRKGPERIPGASALEFGDLETREVFLAEDGPARVVETTTSDTASEPSLRMRYTGLDMARLRTNLKSYVSSVYSAEGLGAVEVTDPLEVARPFHLRLEAERVGIAHTTSKSAWVRCNPWSLVTDLNKMLQPGDPDPREAATGTVVPKDKVKRRTSLELPRPWSGRLEWILHPPEGYAATSLPAAQRWEFGPARLALAWSRGAGPSLVGTFTFVCEKTLWTAAEVDTARAALKVFGEESSPLVVFENVGQAHLDAGRYQQAFAHFQALADRQSKAPEPLVRLSQVQLQGGLVEPAIRNLERAIARNPKAEQPHRQLGWVLQHGTQGQRFQGEWNREGAARELRKAMELAPDLRMARLDLAILLAHDPRGNHWAASEDLEAVARLAQDQLARGQDARARELLTESLVHRGKLEEALASARLMESVPDRQGWTLALEASLGKAEAVLQVAQGTLQDPDVRRRAFESASGHLMEMRRYPEAALFAEAGATGEHAAKLKARAQVAGRTRRHDLQSPDRKTPEGALLSLVLATAHPGFDRPAALALLSPAQQALLPKDPGPEQVAPGLHWLRSKEYLARLQVLDELCSAIVFSRSGSPEAGYKLTFPTTTAIRGPVFVRQVGGTYRVVSWGQAPGRLGAEALHDLDQGNLEGARLWLDRALEQATQPTSQDPLSGHPLVHLWSRGQKGSAEEVRRAAWVAVGKGGRAGSEGPPLSTVLPATTDPLRRSSVLRALIQQGHPDRPMVQAWTGELITSFPESAVAVGLRAECLAEDGNLEASLDLLRAARSKAPADKNLVLTEANLLGRHGRLADSRAVYLKAVEEGLESALILNNLAWTDVAMGTVTVQSLEWAERSLQLSWTSATSHTLACVQALLGHIPEARSALVNAVPIEGRVAPSVWYAQGLLAQALGDSEAARSYFQRVDTPDNPEDPTYATGCRALARQALGKMAGVRTPVVAPRP